MTQNWTRRTVIGATLARRARSRPARLGAETIKIGLVTALSGQSARAGEAITRGLTIAIDELNARGRVLGRSSSWCAATTNDPGKRRDAPRAELVYKERWRYSFAVSTRRCLHRAGHERAKGAVHGTLGRGHGNHQERRQPELRVPRLAVDEIVDKASCSTPKRPSTRKSPALILVNNPGASRTEAGLKAAMAAKGVTPRASKSSRATMST